ncbi:hypothetical protein SLE2022_222880 [Rubroshorea leprosula]
MIAGKSIIGSFSILFTAGAYCIGLMGGDAQDAFDGSDIAMHTTSKSVATVCGATDFKQMCVDKMNNVHYKNESCEREGLSQGRNPCHP